MAVRYSWARKCSLILEANTFSNGMGRSGLLWTEEFFTLRPYPLQSGLYSLTAMIFTWEANSRTWAVSTPAISHDGTARSGKRSVAEYGSSFLAETARCT